MKDFIYLILIGLFISSCSHSDNILDSDDDPELPNQAINIKLEVKQETGNIFEMIQFNIYSENSFPIFDLKNSYDSLIWTVPDLGRFNVYSQTSGEGYYSSHFTSQWSHNFFLPAKYTSILLGYKDNKIIKADTVYINILNDKDFLGYNWKDITTSSGFSTGYVDALSDNYSFTTYQSLSNSIPSITLFLWNERKEDENIFAQKSEKILFDYICSLYSKPTYTTNNSDLLIEKYNNLFKDRIEDAKPLSIWITDKSRIVLYAHYEEYGGYDEYRIHAEPNLN